MSDIGLGQFLKNVFDYSTGKPPSQQPGKVANENFQKAQNEAVKQINQAVQNIAQNFVRQHDIMNTQMQLKDLTNAERSMLLKNLFDFPSNIKDIATFLASDSKVLTAKELQLLMTQPLDMSKLLVLLQTNGKTAMDKITKMIATMNQSGIYNTTQIKEMAILVNACIPANDASTSQILKSFMIMYLPWLPINGATEFNIGSEGSKDGKSGSDEDTITVIITTKNYGMVKILIFKEEGGFNIDINCSEDFPKEKFNAEIKTKSEDASLNLKHNVLYTTRKASKEDKKDSDEAKVEFSKSSKISPQLLIVIHSLIKIVMEIDSQGVLEGNRKEDI